MNNFNIVHAAIRKKCIHANVASEECFEHILTELAPAYHEHIEFYLSFLQDLGLIVYEADKRSISITERGRSTEQIFKE